MIGVRRFVIFIVVAVMNITVACLNVPCAALELMVEVCAHRGCHPFLVILVVLAFPIRQCVALEVDFIDWRGRGGLRRRDGSGL